MSSLTRAIVAVLAVSCAACGVRPDPRRTNFEIRGTEGVVTYDPSTGRLTRVDADTNRNGRFETFSYWDATRVIRIEIDRDEDGRIDRWEHYDDRNQLTRIGSSQRDDQIEDTWTYPDASGLLARVEFDVDRDGTIDKRETYVQAPATPTGRVLSVVDIGLNQAGQPARRLYYHPDGTFARSEALRP